jgi:hypothetical protein
MMKNGLSLLAVKQQRTLDGALRKRIGIWVFEVFQPSSLAVDPVTQTKTD